MTLFEMIKTRPYEMQQEFSCGVRKQNENEVLVSVWRPKAKKCQLAVIERESGNCFRCIRRKYPPGSDRGGRAAAGHFFKKAKRKGRIGLWDGK